MKFQGQIIEVIDPEETQNKTTNEIENCELKKEVVTNYRKNIKNN